MRTIRLIGLPTDRHSSYLRGPARAPGAIRAAFYADAGNPAAENGIELGVDVEVRDAGDAPLREADGDDAVIEAAIRAAVEAGDIPVSLGGDHSVTVPIVKALAAAHGPLEILHFDAHPDLYDDFRGNRRSHASPFARIMEAGLARRLVQVGIRTLNRHQREQAARFGVEIIPMSDFSPGAVPVLRAPFYVSIDLDGFDPAFAPGVSHPEPGGLTVRDVLAAIARQSATLVGADIVELNPDRDVTGLTAVLAAKLVKELAAHRADDAGATSSGGDGSISR
jgi:agmatinase